ncbi:hypothetical protein ONQ97_27480, partial [Salmonella enterica subsp. enterica serovar Virginia]|nr:hypothetical protein [Salmonella enterica subsp. enterica serovar Virginia]
HTALGLALSLAFTGQALAVTTIPFWHSMEGELGKEVDSLAQRYHRLSLFLCRDARYHAFYVRGGNMTCSNDRKITFLLQKKD